MALKPVRKKRPPVKAKLPAPPVRVEKGAAKVRSSIIALAQAFREAPAGQTTVQWGKK